MDDEFRAALMMSAQQWGAEELLSHILRYAREQETAEYATAPLHPESAADRCIKCALNDREVQRAALSMDLKVDVTEEFWYEAGGTQAPLCAQVTVNMPTVWTFLLGIEKDISRSFSASTSEGWDELLDRIRRWEENIEEQIRSEYSAYVECISKMPHTPQVVRIPIAMGVGGIPDDNIPD